MISLRGFCGGPEIDLVRASPQLIIELMNHMIMICRTLLNSNVLFALGGMDQEWMCVYRLNFVKNVDTHYGEE